MGACVSKPCLTQTTANTKPIHYNNKIINSTGHLYTRTVCSRLPSGQSSPSLLFYRVCNHLAPCNPHCIALADPYNALHVCCLAGQTHTGNAHCLVHCTPPSRVCAPAPPTHHPSCMHGLSALVLLEACGMGGMRTMSTKHTPTPTHPRTTY